MHICKYRILFLQCLLTQQPSWDVAANASFLRNKAAMLRDLMKNTTCTCW